MHYECEAGWSTSTSLTSRERLVRLRVADVRALRKVHLRLAGYGRRLVTDGVGHDHHSVSAGSW